jgi:uncharacterized protein YkwD
MAGASTCLSCGPGINQSNGAKLAEALPFIAAAAAAQVAQTAAEQRARKNIPLRSSPSSSGVLLLPDCDNDDQYACVSVTTSPPDADGPPPEMNDVEARDYVLGFVNGVRKLNGAGPVVRDESLDTFAGAASDELSSDHRPNQHMMDHARELRGRSTEVQGPPEGSAPGSLQDQIAEVLVRWMREGPGGVHRDAVLRPEWRKIGVGITIREGRAYLTVDFSS